MEYVHHHNYMGTLKLKQLAIIKKLEMGQRRYVRSFCNDHRRTSKVEAILNQLKWANITRTQGTGSGGDDLSH